MGDRGETGCGQTGQTDQGLTEDILGKHTTGKFKNLRQGNVRETELGRLDSEAKGRQIDRQTRERGSWANNRHRGDKG
jgi:hypothetical protein